MKRTNLLLSILLVMTLLYPALVMLGWAWDFHVVIVHEVWVLGSGWLAFGAISWYLLRHRPERVTAVNALLSSLLSMSTVVHALLLVWEYRNLPVMVSELVRIALAGVVMCQFRRNDDQTDAVAIALILRLILVLFISGFLILFNLRKDTVVLTAISPGGTYRAEVIDSDQGALGGDTIVQVYDLEKQWDTILFLIRKKPQEVYWGDWGEFENMKLEWESEQVLLINGKAYELEE